MFLIVFYSGLLLAGIACSQFFDLAILDFWIKAVTMMCLAYIMIEVGLEFTINKKKLKSYGVDYFVSASAATLPWLLCSAYFLFFLGTDWKESLLVRRSGSSQGASRGEGLAGVGPLKWLGAVLVVIVDKLQYSLFKLLSTLKRAALQNASPQDRKPNLDLIQPRSVNRQEVKDNALVWFHQNSFSFLFRHLFPIQSTKISNVFSDFLRRMRFEIIENDVNLFTRIFLTIQQVFQKTQKLFRSLPLEAFSKDFSGVRIQRREQRLSSMTNVIKFPANDLSLDHGFVGESPLESLNTGFFVNTEDGAIGRWLQIQADDIEHFPLEIGIGGVEPIFELPRFQSRFFQPSMNRADRDMGNNVLFRRGSFQLSESPDIEGSTHITGRFGDKLNELMFLLRGKKNSELLSAAYHLDLQDDVGRNVFAISEPSQRSLVNAPQFEHWADHPLPSRLFEFAESPYTKAYKLEQLSQAFAFPQGAVRSELLWHVSLKSPHLLSEAYRLIPPTNLTNGVLGLYFLHINGKVKFHIKPTKTASNILGGLIFGVGFALAGYCPGTGAAALGQGDLLAIVFMLGLVGGSYIFAELSGFTKKTIDTWGDKGKLTLPAVLGVGTKKFVIVFATILSILLFFLSRV